ncbi:MAG: 50S ribosomal protein L10 [Pseudomonadota bacterium]|nr:50S ribosomal protein L10 [Pseudomonadota bacterium]
MNRNQKVESVSALHQMFEENELLVLTHYSGMTVAQMTDLRRRVRAADAGFKVAKNRLARLALKGTPHEGLDDHFNGPVAIAFSKDPISAAKVTFEFAKGNKNLKIIAGSIGSQMLDTQGVESLAKLPSLDELRGKIIGCIQAPAQKIAVVLSAPGGQIARCLSAHADLKEAA